MKSMLDHSPVMQNVWAWHMALQRCGFKSDDIFVEFARNAGLPGGPSFVFILLKAQGLTFRMDGGVLGPFVEETNDALVEGWAAMWTQLVEDYRAGAYSEESLREVYNACVIESGRTVGLVTALLNKGFQLSRPTPL